MPDYRELLADLVSALLVKDRLGHDALDELSGEWCMDEGESGASSSKVARLEQAVKSACDALGVTYGA